MNVWHLVLCVVILALAYIFFQYARIRKLPEGTDEMQEMAGIIRDGASTFLKTEFRVIAIVVIVVAAVFSLFVEKTSGITFIMGACMSSVVCILGMRSATYANVRTSNRARETLSIGETVKVALGGGSVSGLAVQAFGMLGMVLVLIIWNGVDPTAVGTGFLANLECNPTIMRITTYSLGCSIVAMFNRVAGGNYTKAADISSDILAKLRHDMPEDDSRVPNVIADFIGDNVNDIAGNCSDLLESFVATMAAALMIAVTIYKSALSGGTEAVTEATFTATTVFPIVLAGCGLFGCLLGLGYATIKKMGDNPSHELNLSTWISAGLTVVGGFVAAKLIFADVPLYASFRCGWLSPWISSVLGFAIGSAAFATVSLIVAYVGNYTAINAEPVLNMASYIVVAGGIIGGALIEYFSALLTDNTIESARLMADEGDRQLSRPGVLEGTVRPDYNRCIEMAARQALKKMLLPSVLALLIPIVGGFVFGVEFVGGLLIGATIVAIPRAIFMGNSGGAFDNAKKYIESGSLGGHGKGSDAHKASVVGDTVGDTRKDVVGVALDIFIKTMSTVANTLATVFQHITLIR